MAIGIQRDGDRLAISVFDGVREHVRHDLLDPKTIPAAHDRFSNVEPDLACGEITAELIEDHLDNLSQVDVLRLEDDRSRRDARDVEQVIEQACEATDLKVGLADSIAEGLGGDAVSVPVKRSKDPDQLQLNRVDRIPELV